MLAEPLSFDSMDDVLPFVSAHINDGTSRFNGFSTLLFPLDSSYQPVKLFFRDQRSPVDVENIVSTCSGHRAVVYRVFMIYSNLVNFGSRSHEVRKSLNMNCALINCLV